MAAVELIVDFDDPSADYPYLAYAFTQAVDNHDISAPDWPKFIVKNGGTLPLQYSSTHLGTCPYFEVVAAPGYEFEGVYDETKARVHVTSGAYAWTPQALTYMTGVQIISDATDALYLFDATEIHITNCGLRAGGSGRQTTRVNGSGALLVARNCVALPAINNNGFNVNNGTAHYLNCTARGNRVGFRQFGGTGHIVNCLSDDSDTADFQGTWSTNLHNISSDGTASGTGAITSATVTFAAAGSAILDVSDASGAMGGGADLSAATYPVPLDIVGQTRPTLPTIGVYELDPVVEGGGDDTTFDLDGETSLLEGSVTSALAIGSSVDAQTSTLVGDVSVSQAVEGTTFGISAQTPLLEGSASTSLALALSADAATSALVASVSASLGLGLSADAQISPLVGAFTGSLALGSSIDAQTPLLEGSVSAALALGFDANAQVPLLTGAFSASVGSASGFSIDAQTPVLAGSASASLTISADVDSTISPLVGAFVASPVQEQIGLDMAGSTLALVGAVSAAVGVRITSAATLPSLLGSGSFDLGIGLQADGSITGLQALGELKLGIPSILDAEIPLLVGSPVLAVHHLAPSKRTLRVLARSRGLRVPTRNRLIHVPL